MTSPSGHGSRFWIGNALLAAAAVCLFFLHELSLWLGIWAMVLWMGLAAAGVTLIVRDGQSGR